MTLTLASRRMAQACSLTATVMLRPEPVRAGPFVPGGEPAGSTSAARSVAIRGRLWRFLSALVLMVFCVVAFMTPTSAQDAAAPALPDPLTPEAVQSLVARLSDSEVRELLLQELDARATSVKAAVPVPAPEFVESVPGQAKRIWSQIVQGVETSPANIRIIGNNLGDYFSKLGTANALAFIAVVIAALGIGAAADAVIAGMVNRWAVGRGLAPAPGEPTPAFPASIPFLARRLLFDMSGAVLSLMAATVVMALVLPEREARVGITIALWLVFLPRIMLDLLRFFLSPHRPDLRLVGIDDATARFFVTGIVGVAFLFGLNETVLRVTLEVGSESSLLRSGFFTNTLIYFLLAFIFFVARKGLRQIIRGGQEQVTQVEEAVVLVYPTYAVLVILGTWLASTINWSLAEPGVVHEGRHLLGLALLLIAPMCDTLIRATVRLLAPPMRGTGRAATSAYEAAQRSYVRIARVVVFGAIVIMVARLWDASLFDVARASVDRALGERALGALVILLIGYVAWETVRLLINRRLADEQVDLASDTPPQDNDEGPLGGAASRLGTVLPPVSWTLQAAVIVITALTALSHMGVNVTPLLAGAGILGLALGLGAQTLVADVVSGVFFLIEDSFRVNEYIQAGSVEGTVEKLSLRSMQLRKSDGAINCIPYSNLKSITNLSRDWGTMKAVFTVPFDTDIEKVRKIFKKIGQDLLANPEFADSFIQPFKFKGVSQVNDVGIVVRGKFMFQPEKSMQFMIQREIYRRVQSEFAAAGIEFARREVRVSVDGGEVKLNDPAVKAAVTAAAAATASAQIDSAAAVAKSAG
ncbi:MAG: mechanosensitive ion channel family protein [Paracoccaceae bacterium]